MTETYGRPPSSVLTPLRRNRFFLGKLMDSYHWELEQDYGVRSRRLVNRLGLGAGILCGLGVRLAADGSVCVAPGVAVDGWGREIVVTEPIRLQRVDQPTDDCAHPLGDPVVDGDVTVWLCYRECGAEYTRLSQGDCGHRESCVPGLLDERFALRIGAGLPDDLPGLTVTECRAIFGPAPEGEAPPRRAVTGALLACACPDPEEPCVPLATLTLRGGIAARVDDLYRTYLYSNEELFDLLMCLAARVDACCESHVALAPRVVAMWPPPTGEIDPAEIRSFADERRLEIVFERDMRELGLDQPDTWLGVWQVDPKGVRRLRLSRAGGAFAHVHPAAGEEGAAYDVAIDREHLDNHTIFVVMAAARAGTVIVDEADGLALDADLPATGLTDAERAKLWKLTPGSGRTTSALHNHVLLSAPPGLPSGNGAAGGELHAAFAAKRAEPLLPPQLLAVWPPGAAVLNAGDPDTRAWAERLLDRRQLEVTVSRKLAEASLSDAKAWVRVYIAERDGDNIYSFREIEARVDNVVDDPALPTHPDIITYGVQTDIDAFGLHAEVLVLLRPGAAGTGEPPLGADPPQLLLDADFRGTVLDTQNVISVWDGSWSGPLPDLKARSTLGKELHDGAPGGLVHYAFDVRRD